MQKILLELTGKIKEIEKNQDKDVEVYSALESLGFTRKEIKTALSQVNEETKEVEERIKEALQFLGR